MHNIRPDSHIIIHTESSNLSCFLSDIKHRRDSANVTDVNHYEANFLILLFDKSQFHYREIQVQFKSTQKNLQGEWKTAH
jgi:hypothetical protein